VEKLPNRAGRVEPQKPLPETHQVVLAERRAQLHAQLVPILAGEKRFVWEVGCGHGHFLTAYAAAHPHQICIGIDIASDRIERGLRKRNRAKLPNLHFLRAEARLFLESVSSKQVIQDVFILFPDPWPKSRHHKHRVLQPEFVADLSKRMGEGGRLFFRTDYRPYFDSALAVVRANRRWRLSPNAWPFEQETVFQSRAEEFWSFAAELSEPTSEAALEQVRRE
jgi:tRNA (guanine-N7-)-methyltransferase